MSINNIDKKKFGGKFIATENFKSTKVIASGNSITAVYKKAINKGIKEPVINYIHKKGAVSLY